MRITSMGRAALLAFGLLIGACETREVVVTMTRDDIQERLGRSFPIHKDALVVELILRDPTVTLKNGTDRIGVGMNLDVKVLSATAVTGTLSATGVPRYEIETKSFFLDQPTIERLGIDPV